MRKLTLVFIFIPTLIVVISMIPNASPCAGRGIRILAMKALRAGTRVRSGFWKLKGRRWAKFAPVPRAMARRAGKLGEKVLDEFVSNVADEAGREIVQAFIQEDCPAAMEDVHEHDNVTISDN